MSKESFKGVKSCIKDNRGRGSVGEFLTEKILPGSKLLAVSAYFTIYAYEALCRLFDEQTNNGSNMSHYNKLLKKSVGAVVSTFKKKTIHHLLSGRNAILPDQQSQVTEITDFELITWLVIK
ncbi:MAG TPA: hypothetical protein ACFYD7_13765 [Candidatus Wujingus californicus]|uniref:hypothetical protein n=1 Tax=Candidatus Wunengus californicus TaxID=3367619 RepID=UPI00402641E9